MRQWFCPSVPSSHSIPPLITETHIHSHRIIFLSYLLPFVDVDVDMNLVHVDLEMHHWCRCTTLTMDCDFVLSIDLVCRMWGLWMKAWPFDSLHWWTQMRLWWIRRVDERLTVDNLCLAGLVFSRPVFSWTSVSLCFWQHFCSNRFRDWTKARQRWFYNSIPSEKDDIDRQLARRP